MADRCSIDGCMNEAESLCDCDANIILCSIHALDHSKVQGIHNLTSLAEAYSKEKIAENLDRLKVTTKESLNKIPYLAKSLKKKVLEILKDISLKHQSLTSLKRLQSFDQELLKKIDEYNDYVLKLKDEAENDDTQNTERIVDKDYFDQRLNEFTFNINQGNAILKLAIYELLSKDEVKKENIQNELENIKQEYFTIKKENCYLKDQIEQINQKLLNEMQGLHEFKENQKKFESFEKEFQSKIQEIETASYSNQKNVSKLGNEFEIIKNAINNEIKENSEFKEDQTKRFKILDKEIQNKIQKIEILSTSCEGNVSMLKEKVDIITKLTHEEVTKNYEFRESQQKNEENLENQILSQMKEIEIKTKAFEENSNEFKNELRSEFDDIKKLIYHEVEENTKFKENQIKTKENLENEFKIKSKEIDMIRSYFEENTKNLKNEFDGTKARISNEIKQNIEFKEDFKRIQTNLENDVISKLKEIEKIRNIFEENAKTLNKQFDETKTLILNEVRQNKEFKEDQKKLQTGLATEMNEKLKEIEKISQLYEKTAKTLQSDFESTKTTIINEIKQNTEFKEDQKKLRVNLENEIKTRLEEIGEFSISCDEKIKNFQKEIESLTKLTHDEIQKNSEVKESQNKNIENTTKEVENQLNKIETKNSFFEEKIVKLTKEIDCLQSQLKTEINENNKFKELQHKAKGDLENEVQNKIKELEKAGISLGETIEKLSNEGEVLKKQLEKDKREIIFLKKEIGNIESGSDEKMNRILIENNTKILESILLDRKITSLKYSKNITELKKLLEQEFNIYLEGHTHVVRCVIITSDSKYIVSGSSDNTIRVWDVLEKRQKLGLEGHKGGINSVAVSTDNKIIVSGSDDKSVRI